MLTYDESSHPCFALETRRSNIISRVNLECFGRPCVLFNSDSCPILFLFHPLHVLLCLHFLFLCMHVLLIWFRAMLILSHLIIEDSFPKQGHVFLSIKEAMILQRYANSWQVRPYSTS